MQDSAATALQTSVDGIVAQASGSGNNSISPASTRVPVKALDGACPEYQQCCSTWQDLSLLTGPAPQVKVNAERFLVRKPKEVDDIYRARLERFTYTNIIGNGLGWYVAKLFKDEVDVAVKVDGATVDPGEEEGLEYYQRFLRDCDRAGTPFFAAMQQVFRHICTYRRSYVLIDLPVEAGMADNAADQIIEPYIAIFEPLSVINCERDRYGNLNWIVFRHEHTMTPFLSKPVKVRRWSYYDRTSFRIYEHRSDQTRLQGETEDMAELVSEGLHSLADHLNPDGTTGRVPVVDASVDDILWLGARVYLQQLTFINTENTLDWALFLGNLPMPVIKTDSEYIPEANEAGAVVLKPNDSYEWAEPSGRTFEISKARLDQLREEIYRSMYLQAQGRSSEATPAAQSGVSKEQDMAPSRDVLNAFGTIMRGQIETIMKLIAAIREEDEVLEFEVRGLQHNDDPISTDLSDAQTAMTLGVQSDTFHKEVQKQAIRRYGRNWPREVIEECCTEVDKAPTKSEMETEEKDREEKQMSNKMNAVLSLSPGKETASDEE